MAILISVDKDNDRPLYLQIMLQIKEQIREGKLKAGEELPSVRELAESLDINMHTVRSAYIKLQKQGIIHLRLGRRGTIAHLKKPDNKRAVEAEITARIEEIMTDALLMGLKQEEIYQILRQQTA